ncbi:Uma2 family endonuclease [Microbispora oryzae]|nr:Uma2 family endonuclease [Microbispora oryzae]
MTSVLDDWPTPPGGWTDGGAGRRPPADPEGEPSWLEVPRQTEFVDGSMIFMAPQMRFHERIMYGLRTVLNAQVPGDVVAVCRMDVKLGGHRRTCPDVCLVDDLAAADDSRTFYLPEEVQLIIEVVSPETERADREIKPRHYAAAGIPHFWRLESSGSRPFVYSFGLDPTTGAYQVTGVHHSRMTVDTPFPLDIDLERLPR